MVISASYIVSTYLLALASLSYSADVNKRTTLLKQELKVKESELVSFGANIFTASYISDQNPLNCKELRKAKFDIIRAMNSAIANIPGEIGDKLVNFKDEVFKPKNACTKNFYDRVALERISDKIISELKEDIRKDNKKLKNLTSSLFYTNQSQ